MNSVLLKFAAFVWLILLIACSPQKPPQKPLKMRTLAFGTWVDISIYDLKPEQAEAIGKQLDGALQKMHQDWHAWHPGKLSEVNAVLQKGQSIKLDPQMQQLIELAMAMQQKSSGLFDPAIGELLSIWGFQRDDPFNVKQIPSPQQISQYLAERPSMSDLSLSNDRLSSSNKHVKLDFGGFAKGFGIQLLLHQLQSQGYQNVLINAGGDLMVSGQASNKPWQISIADPFSEEALGKLELTGETAVFTSGNYERGFEVNGIKYHHILNPLNGYPATGIAAVTVVGEDGAWSDAAATTLLLAGVDKAFQIAPEMGARHVLIITDDGQYHLDKGMLSIIELFNFKSSDLVIHQFPEKNPS